MFKNADRPTGVYKRYIIIIIIRDNHVYNCINDYFFQFFTTRLQVLDVAENVIFVKSGRAKSPPDPRPCRPR